MKAPSFIYNKYPLLRQALSNRSHIYNKQLEMVEQMEQDGSILVIRPERPIVVGRMERNVKKLAELYQEGYECAAKAFNLRPEFFTEP